MKPGLWRDPNYSCNQSNRSNTLIIKDQKNKKTSPKNKKPPKKTPVSMNGSNNQWDWIIQSITWRANNIHNNI